MRTRACKPWVMMALICREGGSRSIRYDQHDADHRILTPDGCTSCSLIEAPSTMAGVPDWHDADCGRLPERVAPGLRQGTGPHAACCEPFADAKERAVKGEGRWNGVGASTWVWYADRKMPVLPVPARIRDAGITPARTHDGRSAVSVLLIGRMATQSRWPRVNEGEHGSGAASARGGVTLQRVGYRDQAKPACSTTSMTPLLMVSSSSPPESGGHRRCHCSEPSHQRVTKLLTVAFGPATEVGRSVQARQAELDAVVDLVEEEGPV